MGGFKDTPFDDLPLGDAPRWSFFPLEGSLPLVVDSTSAIIQVARPTLNLCSALTDLASAPACSDKNTTCCHWANKGFCKLGQTCKFAHPVQKQGVGISHRRKMDQSATPLMTNTQARPIDSDIDNSSLPQAEKSEKVCCHWK